MSSADLGIRILCVEQGLNLGRTPRRISGGDDETRSFFDTFNSSEALFCIYGVLLVATSIPLHSEVEAILNLQCWSSRVASNHAGG